MSKGKKWEELAEGGMSRFLCKQDKEEEQPSHASDTEETFLTSLKVFIKGEFQKVNVELKDIRRNLGSLELCLTSIEGKLNCLETCIGQFQGDLLEVTRKVDMIEKKSLAIDSTLKEFEADISYINNNLENLGETVENLDNLSRKNNIKVRWLKENTEGSDLVSFLVKLFSGWASLDKDFELQILTAFRIGVYFSEVH